MDNHLPKENQMKLNLGSFSVMFKGWVNIDTVNDPLLYKYAQGNGFMFYSMDLSREIPFNTNSVDLIYCSHMVEHIDYAQGENFLKECYRILKPGGAARFAVPDLEILIRMYQENRLKELDAINEPSKEMKMDIQKFWHVLTDGHKAAYDCKSFGELCRGAGFTEIKRCKFGEGHPTIMKETKDMFPEISLYVECVK